MSDFSALLSPTKARLLPSQSRERSVASHSLRQAWHYIFDYCPKLLALYAPSGKEFLDPFLDHIEANNIGLNWKIFFHIIDQHLKDGKLTQELCADLMMAAAVRWTLSDFTKSQSIFIVEKNFGISVLGLKASSIDEEKKFKAFKHSHSEKSHEIFYSVSIERNPESHDNWEIIQL